MRFNIHLLLAIIFINGLFARQGKSHPEPAQVQQHQAYMERVAERHRMVRDDIENYPYFPVKNSAVLDAMRRVPRHVFVPEEARQLAYDNRPLPIGYNQTISQPFIVANMTELLALDAAHKVLEIGTGSGYQAAVLAELCDSVYTIEIIPPLGERAALVLRELGYHKIQLRIGNGYKGWPEQAPFDRIIVTCAPDDIPEALVEQLAPGGQIIIPVGSPYQTQYLVLVKKNRKGRIISEKQYPVRFVPMTGKD
ncbi:MAG: protein-L-isoaspartate(D-aspartate) O-methyltransferase [Bacteroidetes bacterium]|nr:protein-L-isoaspartate(D-aspartate) O-methyltransferase [Bacteroidota bacterium]